MAENVFAVTQGGVDAPVTVDEIDREDMQVNAWPARPAGRPRNHQMLSAGKPLPNTQVRVVDENGASLGPNARWARWPCAPTACSPAIITARTPPKKPSATAGI